MVLVTRVEVVEYRISVLSTTIALSVTVLGDIALLVVDVVVEVGVALEVADVVEGKVVVEHVDDGVEDVVTTLEDELNEVGVQEEITVVVTVMGPVG